MQIQRSSVVVGQLERRHTTITYVYLDHGLLTETFLRDKCSTNKTKDLTGCAAVGGCGKGGGVLRSGEEVLSFPAGGDGLIATCQSPSAAAHFLQTSTRG